MVMSIGSQVGFDNLKTDWAISVSRPWRQKSPSVRKEPSIDNIKKPLRATTSEEDAQDPNSFLCHKICDQ
jgi:hypothetical protein